MVECSFCDRPAGFVEPGSADDRVRPVCFECKGPEAWAVNPGDLAAAALFGASVPGPPGGAS